jgi:hypothetical protein
VRIIKWILFVDVVTVIWLVVFAIGIITTNENTAYRCNFISLLLLPVFVVDLYFLFKQADNFRVFVKKRWFDILLVIPYFRIFRILKFVRLLKVLKIIKMRRLFGLMRATKKGHRTAKLLRTTDSHINKERIMSQTCYMCNSASTSVEHVPPKCLFPEKKDLPEGVDLRKQLITVPACDEHNTHKSKNDEYLLYVLVMSIPSNDVGKNQFLTKIIRAIEKNPVLINQFLDEKKTVVVEDIDTLKVDRTIAMKVDKERLENELIDLTRALYFHHFKQKWLGKVNVYPSFLLELDPEIARELNQPIENMDYLSNLLFENKEFHGENPDVFKYQIVDGQESCHKYMRLYFYNGNRVTVIIGKNS